MTKTIGGVALLLVALFLLRGGDAAQLLAQVGQMLEGLVGLGGELAKQVPIEGRP